MMRSLTIILLIVLILFCPLNFHAWDGFAYDSEDYIEVEDPKAVVPGRDIEIYDYSDESYHDVNVISVNKNGSTTIEVFDHNTGDYRMFEMENESKTKESIHSNVL